MEYDVDAEELEQEVGAIDAVKLEREDAMRPMQVRHGLIVLCQSVRKPAVIGLVNCGKSNPIFLTERLGDGDKSTHTCSACSKGQPA